jgi:HAE1 family hydrophobic/amphiphilic exporter-1
MNGLIRAAIEQPITVAVGVILALVAGFVALDRVAIQMTPDVDETVVSVTTLWENASPQEIESEVVDPQEEKLQGVTGLVSLASTSQRGQAQLRLQFRTGTQKEDALREVSNKLREVPVYPDGVDEPVVEASDPESRDYIAWYQIICTDPDFDVRTLRDFFEKRVEPRLERLPGMASVGLLGGREREVQIRFDPVRLAQRGVTMAEFVAAIGATNRNFSAGALQQGKQDVRIRTVGRFRDPEQVLDTVLRQDAAGAVRVRDVAEVVQTYKEADAFVRANGRPSMAMNFERDPGTNVLEVMTALQAELARLQQDGGLLDSHARALGLDGEIRFVESYDQTDYIYQALDLVEQNLYVGGALSVVVLLLFLRSLRTVGIVALAIPVSVIGAVVAMVGLGRSVNVISLAGMAFAVGMVVDNAIVVIENVFRHLEMGKKPPRAAFDGTREVAGAVLASTLTTVVVFVPILLIEETAGQLFRDIALAICASVLLSYVASVLLIPSAAALLLKPRTARAGAGAAAGTAQPPGRLRRAARALSGLLDVPRQNARLVEFLLDRPLLRYGVILLFVAVSIVGTVLLVPPVDYLPQGNRNIVFGAMLTPSGYSLEQQLALGDRVERQMAPFFEDSGVPEAELPQYPSNPYDPTSPPMTPPRIDQYFLVGITGQLFHGSISAEPARVVDLIPLMNAASGPAVLPGVISFAFQFPLFRLGGSSGSAVKIDVAGVDLDRVSGAAGALFGELAQAYGPQTVQPSPSNFDLPGPELRIVPDLLRMSDLELRVADLGLAVQAASDGALVGQYELGDELIDLKVIARNAVDHHGLDRLGEVPTATPTGDVVALGSVSDFQWVTAPEQIRRVGRQRAVTLEFTPPAGKPLQEALDDIDRRVADLRGSGAIASDVDVSLAGTASKLGEILNALLGDGSVGGLLASSLFLALLVVYLLMAVLFQSWVYPLVIMFSVPLATLGGFLALFLVHEASLLDRHAPVQNLDVLSLLGFVILAGVVVNNAILLVSQAQNFLAGGEHSDLDDDEMTPRHAVVLAVRSRVRPIFMSMLTSVGGMLPLVVTPGSGSELYRGLGAVVLGGLLISTIFTLILVPLVLGTVFEWFGAESRDVRRAALGLDETPAGPGSGGRA